MRAGERLATAWRGDLPLWLTYWVLGVGGNMSFLAALLATLSAEMARREPSERRPELPVGIYLASLGWFMFIFGAIWRSAGRYRGPRRWANLARLGVACGVPRMAAEALTLRRTLGAP